MRVEGNPDASGYLNCYTCPEQMDAAARRRWNCGRLPRVPGQTGAYPLPGACPKPTDDVCPGHLLQLGQVRDGLRAYGWWDKGQLGELLDGRSASPLLRDVIDLVSGAFTDQQLSVEAERERERKRQQKR